MASDSFDFTSQNKFSLARLFLVELSTVNVPLCNLKSEELECWAFFLTVKDPHTNTKYMYYVPSGQIPRRDVVRASLFHFGQVMTNI